MAHLIDVEIAYGHQKESVIGSQPRDMRAPERARLGHVRNALHDDAMRMALATTKTLRRVAWRDALGLFLTMPKTVKSRRR
jgi:hypothetical protein